MPQKDGRRNKRRPAPFGARKTFSHFRLAFSARLVKTGSTQALVLLTPVAPPAAPGRHGRPRGLRLPRSVAEVLGTGRLPDNFFGVLSAHFRVVDTYGASPPLELCKLGGFHAFLGRITAEATPVPGLAGLALLGADRDGGSHILHSFFSVPVGPYDPYRLFFGCRG